MICKSQEKLGRSTHIDARATRRRESEREGARERERERDIRKERDCKCAIHDRRDNHPNIESAFRILAGGGGLSGYHKVGVGFQTCSV